MKNREMQSPAVPMFAAPASGRQQSADSGEKAEIEQRRGALSGITRSRSLAAGGLLSTAHLQREYPAPGPFYERLFPFGQA